MNASNPQAPVASARTTSRRAHSSSTRTMSRRNTQSSLSMSTTPSALQQEIIANEHPHLATGPQHPPSCLCSSCHLKPVLFPRRQDGRIVLPHPWSSNARSESTSASAPQQSGLHPSAHAASPERSLVVREERPGPFHVQVEVDKGEGTSSGSRRLSGPGVVGVEDKPMRFPPLVHEFEIQDNPECVPSRLSSRGKRSSRSNRSKLARQLKPYDVRPERPEPWPRIAELDQLEQSARSGRNTPIQYTPYTSEQARNSPNRNRMEPWPDPYEILGAQAFPQLVELPGQLGLRSSLSGSSMTFSQPMSFDVSSEQNYRRSVPPVDAPSIPRSTSPSRTVLQERFMPLPARSIDSSERHPEDISSNPRPTNPRSNTSRSNKMDEDDGNLPQEGPSSQQHEAHSHTWPIRFQSPVTPEVHYASPIRPRQLSIVQVKWDSDRKRRQGYFAQEEGSEKSNFRHYNKEDCDFNN